MLKKLEYWPKLDSVNDNWILCRNNRKMLDQYEKWNIEKHGKIKDSINKSNNSRPNRDSFQDHIKQ